MKDKIQGKGLEYMLQKMPPWELDDLVEEQFKVEPFR